MLRHRTSWREQLRSTGNNDCAHTRPEGFIYPKATATDLGWEQDTQVVDDFFPDWQCRVGK